jgi:hypothetical protein
VGGVGEVAHAAGSARGVEVVEEGGDARRTSSQAADGAALLTAFSPAVKLRLPSELTKIWV